jgi:uncharacterized protein (DUF736 family)
MAKQERDMSGILSKNDRKKTEKQPDYRGRCCIRGEQLEISAWVHESPNGGKFLTLKYQEPRDKDANQKDDFPF